MVYIFPTLTVMIELLCLKLLYSHDGVSIDLESVWYILQNLTASQWQINFKQTIRNEIATRSHIMQHFARVAILQVLFVSRAYYVVILSMCCVITPYFN